MTFLGDTGAGTHAVQFYESAPFLHRAIEQFFSPALMSGEPLVMIARRRTFESVADRLAPGLGVSSLEAAGRIMFVDVDTVLDGFVDGGLLDPARVEQGLSSLLDQARLGRPEGTIRIYGEIVDVLCRDGNFTAAVRLEEIWNAMIARGRAALMCGYAIEDFDNEVNANHIRAVCREHTHVVPTEDYTDAPEGQVRDERVVLLQHRARALDRLLGNVAPPVIATTSAAATGPMVYVVDDDASVRRSLERLLGSASLPVTSFASAEAFLAAVDTSANACVIIDADLTGMSGTELLARIAEGRWPMSVIAISASDDQQIELESWRLGATAFLLKPFRSRELLDAIAKTKRTGFSPSS